MAIYPRLLRRVQAVLIDSVIWPIVFISLIAIVSSVGIENEIMATAIAFVPALSLEPLLVSLTGGTIGHHYIGLRVCSAKSGRKVNLINSYLRSFLKFVLGFPSLIFVLTTRRHQAIHDLLTKSVVVLVDPERKPASEALTERVKDTENYIYPSRVRRVVVTFLYLGFSFALTILLLYAVLSSSCISGLGCSKVEVVIYFAFEVVFLVSLFAIPGLGWSSRLYGCRKTKLNI